MSCFFTLQSLCSDLEALSQRSYPWLCGQQTHFTVPVTRGTESDGGADAARVSQESGIRKYPRNGCFWTSRRTHTHTPPNHSSLLLLVSSALIGLYTVVQCVTTSSALQHCCGWLLHHPASCYTLTLFMQTCLCGNGTLYLFIYLFIVLSPRHNSTQLYEFSTSRAHRSAGQ